jgi:phosphoglycolate phosphatase-like HAD superfamily hydrolase
VREYSVVFWDFDGVVKESVSVKTAAYERLFEPFGVNIAARVREHHECNGGMSRFEKIPLYLEWAGQAATRAEVGRICELFSAAVRQAVIDSAWVPGAREYLRDNHERQHFALISATPQKEIEDILRALDIACWFREVHGAPTPKAVAIAAVLARWACRPEDALLIGDSESDSKAAAMTGVHFLLRRTALNVALQRAYAGPQCENFIDG